MTLYRRQTCNYSPADIYAGSIKEICLGEKSGTVVIPQKVLITDQLITICDDVVWLESSTAGLGLSGHHLDVSSAFRETSVSDTTHS